MEKKLIGEKNTRMETILTYGLILGSMVVQGWKPY